MRDTAQEASFKLAAKKRERTLQRMQEIMTACRCQFPIVTMRNGHGHGLTITSEPCPAIAIIEKQREEDDELKALVGG